MKRPYFCNCVSWSPDQMPALEALIDRGEEIQRSEFLQLVNPADQKKIETGLGYDRHLKMEEDWHVRYFRDPVSGIPFFVHSAVEHVFARPEEIDALTEDCLTEADRATSGAAPVLILVHPGSMMGSARMNLGKFEADAARDAVLEEVISHEGGLIVIDGAFSDELQGNPEHLISGALAAARGRGELALRLWGCDAGEAPYRGWEGLGELACGLVHDGQCEAATALVEQGVLDGTRPILVTGAWASDDGTDGCVTSVADRLRDLLGPQAPIAISENALRLSLGYAEENLDEEEDGPCPG